MKRLIALAAILALIFAGGCAKFSEKELLSFSLMVGDLACEGAISSENVITLTVPYNTDISKLTPQLEISGKAQVSPEKGNQLDFTQPVTYTVTAQDGTSASYIVIVSFAPNTEKEIVSSHR